MDINQLRREYRQGGLHRGDLLDNPVDQFQLWLEQAIAAEIPDPTAFTVATVSAEGQPSQRLVLLKHVAQDGFVFYTNFGSRKAREIANNNKVSLHFPWHAMDRQVTIRGCAEIIPAVDSLKYFISRPRESQLAAWASSQSRPISSRQFLMQQFHAMKQKFLDGEVPLPDFWGGYRIKPLQIEFWQGGVNRLHDRFEYSLDKNSKWSIERLAP